MLSGCSSTVLGRLGMGSEDIRPAVAALGTVPNPPVEPLAGSLQTHADRDVGDVSPRHVGVEGAAADPKEFRGFVGREKVGCQHGRKIRLDV